MIKLGSLFDGSGGFPLAGSLYGIVPVWASEIEPYPMRVTALRFPNMKQLGDVTKINGAEIEPVDIITFGSPCQDLSVAGLQKGIHDGERSNLFFEAIRIIKEMRNATANVYPRFGVWENVPGAFSSNKGEDFRAVIEAFASVCEDGVAVPQPPKGKWNKAGGVVGDNWSLAWRVYDAQYWGVPQRRKRIYLVADFASRGAPEILFERESLRGDSAESGAAGEGTADDAEGSAGGNGGVRCLNPWDVQSYRQYDADGSFATLQARENSGLNHQGVCYPTPPTDAAGFKGRQGAKSGSTGYGVGVAPTLVSGMTVDTVYCLQGNGIDRADTAGCNGCGWRTDQSYTLNTIDRPAVAIDCRNHTAVYELSCPLQAKNASSLNFINPVCVQNTGRGWWNEGDTGATLRTPSGGAVTVQSMQTLWYTTREETGRETLCRT